MGKGVGPTISHLLRMKVDLAHDLVDEMQPFNRKQARIPLLEVDMGGDVVRLEH